MKKEEVPECYKISVKRNWCTAKQMDFSWPSGWSFGHFLAQAFPRGPKSMISKYPKIDTVTKLIWLWSWNCLYLRSHCTCMRIVQASPLPRIAAQCNAVHPSLSACSTWASRTNRSLMVSAKPLYAAHCRQVRPSLSPPSTSTSQRNARWYRRAVWPYWDATWATVYLQCRVTGWMISRAMLFPYCCMDLSGFLGVLLRPLWVQNLLYTSASWLGSISSHCWTFLCRLLA